MPEGRMLKRNVSESKKLGKLKSDSARLLYTWLIPWLDVEGRHSADPEIIKGHIFPKVKSMTINKIVKLLNELSMPELIILYEANGEILLQLVGFLKYQKIAKEREAISRFPGPTKENIITHENSGLNHENSSTIKLKTNISKDNISKDNVKEQFNINVINYFNKVTGQQRSHTGSEAKKLINGRFEEGRTLEDFKHVIDTKTAQWLNDQKMRKYLRPVTLFAPGKFEDYLNEPYEKPGKVILEPGEANPKDKLPLTNDEWEKVAKHLFNNGESESDVSKFYGKALKAFPKIRDQWERSDKKPGTFIILVVEANGGLNGHRDKK